jgi:hypothetical protein
MSIIIDPALKVNAWTIQAAHGENVTFWIQFPESLIDFSVSILVNGFSSNNYMYSTTTLNLFKVTFPASTFAVSSSYYSVVINGSKASYVSKVETLSLKIVSSWKADIELVIPPALSPWNTLVNFTIRYYSTDGPRNGWAIAGATISKLQLQLITDTGAVSQLILSASQIGTVWSYIDQQSTLGAGYYTIFFNSSYLTIPKLQAYYIIPTIQGGLYQTAEITPFIWIRPVETALKINTVKQDQTSLIVEGLEDELNQINVINAYFNVSDIESVMNGNSLSSATLTYTIYYKGNSTVFASGNLVKLGSGSYSFDLVAITLGNYTVKIQASLTNYVSQSIEFDFVVLKRTFIPAVGLSDSLIAQVNQGVDLSISINITDRITRTPVRGGNLTFILNDEFYSFTDSDENPGIYMIKLSANKVNQLPEDSELTIVCKFDKDNYTSQEFNILIQIGLKVDPILKIPYRYWIIFAVTFGSFIALAVARSAYLKATVPMTIQNINRVANIIKKGKLAPDRKFELSSTEEILKVFSSNWSLLQLDLGVALGLSSPKDTSESSEKEHKDVLNDKELDNILSQIEETGKDTTKKVTNSHNVVLDDKELDDIFNSDKKD